MHVVIVYYEDWAEMFLDGTSVLEGHSIRPDLALEACGVEVTTKEATASEEREKSGLDFEDEEE